MIPTSGFFGEEHVVEVEILAQHAFGQDAIEQRRPEEEGRDEQDEQERRQQRNAVGEVVDIEGPELQHGTVVVACFFEGDQLKAMFLEQVLHAVRGISGEIVWDLVFGPGEGAGGQQQSAGLEGTVDFPEDAGQVEDMLEGFGGEEAVGALIRKGEGMSVVEHIHLGLGVVVPAHLDIESDILRGLGEEVGIGFGAAAQINDPALQLGCELFERPVEGFSGEVEGVGEDIPTFIRKKPLAHN